MAKKRWSKFILPGKMPIFIAKTNKTDKYFSE
jgi:hypothetical protein